MFRTPEEEKQAGLYKFKASLVRHNKFQASGEKQSETLLQTTKKENKTDSNSNNKTNHKRM